MYNQISRITNNKTYWNKIQPPLLGTQPNKQGTRTYWDKKYNLPLYVSPFKNIFDQYLYYKINFQDKVKLIVGQL